MSDIIQLLPDSVANQIAAGEVIQRPASVIKELVENAVDAGAKRIDVLVEDAGKTSIQVIDDGKGMSDTDARLAFERHATSKIRQADDLFSLHTMGFRGEALASIAAVAQVELKTRQQSEEVGTLLSISGCKVLNQEPAACPAGSNFLIQNLFFNVPARRKFLKSNTTELNNIMAAFERIVLVYPHIHFTFTSNGTEMLSLRAVGDSFRQRIIDVFGKRLNQNLLPVGVDTTVCSIHGFVGKPEAAKKKNAHQYFFVNGRYMKHPYFNKAVMMPFERLIPQGEQVPYFIYFDVPAEDIDVNIHPTKTEIKFENEQTIWQILMAAVKDSLGRFNDVPSIDFDQEGRPDIPMFHQEMDNMSVEMPKVDFNPQYNPFNSNPRQPSVPENWEQLYESQGGGHGGGLSAANGGFGLSESGASAMPADNGGVAQSRMNAAPLFPDESFDLPAADESQSPTVSSALNGGGILEDKSPAHYQYKGRYIMTAVKSGLMIIDQHRAHIRVLYDGYMRQISDKQGSSQKLLFPEMVQFSPSDNVVFQSILEDMQLLGFDFQDLGGGSYAVGGIPAGLDGLKPTALVQDIVALAAESTSHMADDINHSVALGLARNAAIPYGQVLGNKEMENLVNELFASTNVNYAPDGKTIISILSQSEIDHLF